MVDSLEEEEREEEEKAIFKKNKIPNQVSKLESPKKKRKKIEIEITYCLIDF